MALLTKDLIEVAIMTGLFTLALIEFNKKGY